jgi:hypothetical protein
MAKKNRRLKGNGREKRNKCNKLKNIKREKRD